MSYRENPNVSIVFQDGLLVVEDERRRRTVDLDARRLDESAVRGAMVDADCASGSARALVEALAGVGALLPIEGSPLPDERQSRSYGYLASRVRDPRAAQQRLSATSVMILGVGGTGSVVLQHLVGAGVRDLVLVDHDTVELSNLNRQFLFTADDVGGSKLVAARDYVEARAVDSHVEIVERRIEVRSDVEELLAQHPGVSVVVSCIDGPPGIEPHVVSACLAAGRTVMTGAVGIEFGHVGPLFTAGSHPCLSCWYATRRAPAPVTRWSHGVTNTLVGALMAQKVTEWGLGVPDLVSERVTLDFVTLEVHRSRADPVCDHA